MEKGNDLIVDTSYKLQSFLHPIIGFSNILIDRKLNAKQRELVEGIYLSAKNWFTVIKNFCEFCRFSTESLELYYEPFNLRQCVKEAQNVLRTKATAQNKSIICLIDESVPSIFMGDVRRLYQILVNLLNYALDFGQESEDEIVLSLRCGAISSELHFTIDGVLIQPDHIDSLFCFSSATRPNLSDWNQRLTLALSKRLVEMMGGTFRYIEKGVICFTVLAGSSDMNKQSQYNLELIGQHLIEPITLTYTMISMSAQLIKTPLSEESHDFVETIYSHAIKFQNTINNLQDFNDLKNGQLRLKREPFYLRKWIKTVVNLFSEQASSKGLSITYMINSQVPKKVIGDALPLYQILYNLLDNALKFTQEGQISLFVDQISPENKEQCELYFAVQDTGRGIEPQDIDYLFTMSCSPRQFYSHRYQPKGLGLLINKELVELMGGQIWVESQTGAGSTFYFTVIF